MCYIPKLISVCDSPMRLLGIITIKNNVDLWRLYALSILL